MVFLRRISIWKNYQSTKLYLF